MTTTMPPQDATGTTRGTEQLSLHEQALQIEAWNASLPPAPTPDEIPDAAPYWKTRPKGAGHDA